MSKSCKDCHGRGSWQESIESLDGIRIVWNYCETCYGPGISQDPEDMDDFDIDGSSYAETD